MGKIREYIEKIGDSRNVEKMEYLGDMLEELICNLKESHHDMYEHYKMKLYEMAYGKKINEDMAYKIVQNMKPLGEYWDMETIKNVKYNNGLSYSDCDFYVVMNSLVNDYGKIIDKEDVETYVKMASAFIDDEDATKDKVFDYFNIVTM